MIIYNPPSLQLSKVELLNRTSDPIGNESPIGGYVLNTPREFLKVELLIAEIFNIEYRKTVTIDAQPSSLGKTFQEKVDVHPPPPPPLPPSLKFVKRAVIKIKN